MMAAPSTMARMGRKRRPPPRGTRTLSQRFARNLHRLAGDRTNKEIADAVGVNASAVGHWMAGRDVPHLDLWPAIARVLGVDVQELLPD